MVRTLNRTVLAGGVVYPAGTAEANVVDGTIPDQFWDGDSSDSTTEGYSSWSVGDLESEVAKRNTGREDADAIEVTGTGKDGKVLKKDLIAALEADDTAAGA